MSRKIVIGAIFSFTFLVFSLFLVVVLFIIFQDSTVSSQQEMTHYYQHQELVLNEPNPKLSIVSLPRKLTGDQYLSYSNDHTSTLNFISRTGGQRYECTGSCSCKSSSRRNALVLTRSLFVAVSALSTAMAVQMAQESFQKGCEDFSDLDDDDLPESGIDREEMCQKLDDLIADVEECGYNPKPFNTNIRFDGDGDPKDTVYDRYECEGNCIYAKEFVRDQYTEAQEKLVGKCSDLDTSGFVTIKRTIEEPANTEIHIARARYKFLKVYMIPFCRILGRIPYYESVKLENGEWERKRHDAYTCVATYSPFDDKELHRSDFLPGFDDDENYDCVYIESAILQDKWWQD